MARVRLVRSGGFAGIRRQFVFDTGDLAPEPATEFFELWKATKVESSHSNGNTAHVDRFHFQIEVEDERCDFDEVSMPKSAAKLIEFVTSRGVVEA